MDQTSFIVPGRPVGKERPRRGKNGTFYTPPRTREYENLVAWRAKMAHVGAPFEGPVKLEVEIHSRKSRADTSNILKAIEDAMNGIVYHDDRQIQEIHVYRIKSDKEEVHVTVSRLRGEVNAESEG